MFSPPAVVLYNSQKQFTRVYSATHRQQNYEHDYTRLKFRDWGIETTQVRPGKPITVTFDDKSFHGYVHDVKNVQENQKNITELSIIGASYVMRQASQTVYKNVTADQVVKTIAKKYGFAYNVW